MYRIFYFDKESGLFAKDSELLKKFLSNLGVEDVKWREGLDCLYLLLKDTLSASLDLDLILDFIDGCYKGFVCNKYWEDADKLDKKLIEYLIKYVGIEGGSLR